MSVENLERRRLFATMLVGTELRVFGTPGNDVITVSQLNAGTIRVVDNGVITNWPDAVVNTLRLNATNPAVLSTGTAGLDTVQIISTAALPLTENALLLGGQGIDVLRGGAGNDSLVGDSENDQLFGSDGNDTINGGLGNNIINGENGNDSMFAGTGNDIYNGGNNTDIVDYSLRTVALKITIDGVANDGNPATGETDNVNVNVENILGGSLADTIVGSAGPNALGGGPGNDLIVGNAGNDTIRGGTGNDVLAGGLGNDSIAGEDGNDSLYGGANSDTLSGGNNDDVLVGGAGADRSSGDSGNDNISASDGAIDLLSDGGIGFDIIDIDVGDPFANGELII